MSRSVIEREQALANEQGWWHTGHTLNEASEALNAYIAAGDFSQSMKVGGTVARLCSPDNFGYVWRHRLAADMLYAFAVENWLKGLLVATYQRSSKEQRKKIDVMIDEYVDTSPSITDDTYMLAVLQAMRTDPISKEIAELESQEVAENAIRAAAVKAHNTHDLERLAEAAGVIEEEGDDELREYLQALSILTQIGRYPVHSKLDNRDLTHLVSNAEIRARLNEMICQRYMKVRPMSA